jgi:predicted nucleic acid-binding protein
LADIRTLCRTIVSLNLETHSNALRVAEHQGYAIFNALIVASAPGAGCDTLSSEGMQDGAGIDGRLRIANPF